MLQAHPGFGDDAQNPLRANKHTVRAWAGARPRQATRGDNAVWGDDSGGLDKVINMGVQRGKMSARAGCDPAAQRRELERLGIMPQGIAVRFELGLKGRAVHTGLNAGRARGLINFQHFVEVAQIDGHAAGIGVARRRLNAACHARSSPKGNGCRTNLVAPVQY